MPIWYPILSKKHFPEHAVTADTRQEALATLCGWQYGYPQLRVQLQMVENQEELAQRMAKAEAERKQLLEDQHRASRPTRYFAAIDHFAMIYATQGKEACELACQGNEFGITAKDAGKAARQKLHQIMENHRTLHWEVKMFSLPRLARPYFKNWIFRDELHNAVQGDLQGMTFRYCDFGGNDLRNCDFQGCDITGSSFEGAKVNLENINKAIIRYRTMPLWETMAEYWARHGVTCWDPTCWRKNAYYDRFMRRRKK